MSILMYTGAAAFLLAALAISALHARPVQDRLLRLVANTIEKDALVTIRYGAFTWEPFSELSLSGIELRSADQVFFQSDKADLTYGFRWSWPFFVPEELALTRPVVKLEKRRGGKLAVPQSGERRPEISADGSPFWASIPLPRVVVISGTVEARQKGQTVLLLQNLNGAIPIRMVPGPKGPRLKLDIGEWRGQGGLPLEE